MKRIPLPLLLLVLLSTASAGFCAETSFRTVRMPTPNRKQVKAVLTFSDNDKAVEVHPKKGDPVTVPYSQIEKVSYEYTSQVMGGKDHWLKIDYNQQEGHKVLLLLMSEHDYIRILDAVKAHTGMDPEILGSADRGLK